MRLFIGIPVPVEIASLLSAWATRLPPGFRLSRPDQMHITLSFLGQVPEHRLTCIDTRLQEVRRNPFSVTVTGLGAFPGVCFAAIEANPQLNVLAADIVGQMALCGLPPETRPFHPHITLARTRERHPDCHRAPSEPCSFSVDAFVLYSSQPAPRGSHYEVLRRFPLRG